jgi:hypothetical protein
MGISVNPPLRIDMDELASWREQEWGEDQTGSCRIDRPEMVGSKFRRRSQFRQIRSILLKGSR